MVDNLLFCEVNRLILFSCNYTPLRNPRSFRMKLHFPILGEITETKLITARTAAALEQDDPKIYRVGFKVSDPGVLRNRLKEYPIMRFLHGLMFPDDQLIHQVQFLWYYFWKIRKKNDIILTVSNPFSSHLIGFFLKRIFGHKWIADTGDLFYIAERGHSAVRKTIERIVLKRADVIVVNSEMIKKYYVQELGLDQHKIEYILNGNALDFSGLKWKESATLRFSFIGTTYSGIRDGLEEVQMILSAMRECPNTSFVIQFFGRQCEALQKVIKMNPAKMSMNLCNSDESLLEAYANTDILLNFSNGNYPGLPSKLESYLSSGIPIINFYKEETESSYCFLQSYVGQVKQVQLVPDSSSMIAAFVKALPERGIPCDRSDGEEIKRQWSRILKSLSG